MNRFRFKPGLLTERTAMALNDIAAWIEREERTRKGDSEFPTVERRRVKLTAHNGGTPPIYTGVEQSFTIAGVEEDKPNGESFSPTNQPIYERNGQTVSAAALTAGYHCWVDRRTLVDGTPTYEFDIGNPSTSGSFTLAGRTGTPQTISSGDTLTLNNGVVSATDTWTPDTASASLAGIVSTGTQSIAGDKTFLSGTLQVGNAVSDSLVLDYSSGGGYYGSIYLGPYVAGLEMQLSSPLGTGYTALQSVDAGGVYQAGIDPANSRFYIGNPLSAIGPAKYAVTSGGAYHDGATGTSGGGDTVKGGIVTALGSALTGFTDELAQDAVGTILVDTATIDLTYTDGTPSITADAIYQMSITADASGLKLSGDSASPGNSYYYGTNGGGTKGYYALPQAADVGALTDSTGGTANTTLVAIAGTGDDTNLNDNFADLVAQINALRTALRNAGLMA